MSRRLLSALFLAGLLAAPVCAQAELFEAPVALTADGHSFSSIIYPTPVLHDIDGDGTRELIVGDLIGKLYAHEPVEGAATAWGPAQPLEAEGEPLTLNNW